MKLVSNPEEEIKLFSPTIHNDKRGFFVEKFNDRLRGELDYDFSFVQENESFSSHAGTLRGIHYQKPPFEQTKILTVQRGSILDVAIDLRPESSNFGKNYTYFMSAEERKIIVIPKGYGHAFCTLEDNTLITYKVDSLYSKTEEITIRWDDQDIGINWPHFENYNLSEKDKNAPYLKQVFPEAYL